MLHRLDKAHKIVPEITAKHDFAHPDGSIEGGACSG